ncbi:MAG: sulfatase-like hydrolase/transferase [Bacteroidota bacterium]
MNFLRLAFLLSTLCCADFHLFSQHNDSIPAHDPPNILLIMCDDLGWGDVGFNGNRTILTPHLDRLAQQGMIFSRFYSAGSVCSPTRASCITGRNPFRMGITHANTGHMKPEEITLPELLREQGYTNGHFGKWHLGTLTAKLEDANRGHPRDHTHYSLPSHHGYDQWLCTESKVPTWDPLYKPTTFDEETGESLRYGWAAVEEADDAREIESYGTYYWEGPEQMALQNVEGGNARIIMDRVIPFVQSAHHAHQPFFATIWFHTPHLPLVTGKQYRQLYNDLSHQEQLHHGAISAMDDQVGRLFAELERLGIDANTMIWFCSDNGPENATPGSSGPFRARKRSLYEGGVRVPAFVHWPARIAGGQKREAAMVTSDYLPTILSYVGGTYPDPDRPLDGIDLHPILEGKRDSRQHSIGFQYPKGRVSWVMDQYKLVRDSEEKSFELYDLLADPGESQNLIDAHPSIADKMREDLEEWIASCLRSETGEDYQD